MEIISLISPDYRSNTHLAVSNGKCIIIDSGLDVSVIENSITEHSLKPVAILLTHGHFDHIFSLDLIREKYDIPVYIHAEDREMLTDSMKNAYSFFFGANFRQKDADRTFVNGDKIAIDNEYLTVIHTPGHSKGSSCFLCDKILITGDTLFADGIGRTDLHGGDGQIISASLSNLKNIENAKEITIFPGHGGAEKLTRALDNVLYF